MTRYYLISLIIILFSTGILSAQTLNLPARSTSALNGDQVVTAITPLSLTDRENYIANEVLTGNIPSFYRNMVLVKDSALISGSYKVVSYYTIADYLALGHDTNYYLCPMTPILGQRLADSTGCMLPTSKMVDQIWENAPLHLQPQTIPPSAQMTTVPVMAQHNNTVWGQREPILNSYPLGTLVGGDKKDVVISNLIYTSPSPRRVIIYGWHQTNGNNIQPRYPGHIDEYADYSHGIRLVQKQMFIDGTPTTGDDILASSTNHVLLSDEGVINVPYYPDTTTVPPTPSAPNTPTSFCVLNGGSGSVQITIKADANTDSYNVYQSTDGINFSAPTNHTTNTISISGLTNNTVYFYKLEAVNAHGTSGQTEVLGATPSSSTSNVLVVNGFDRASTGNTYNFIIQHGNAIHNYGYRFSSATNEAIIDGLQSLNYYPIVDYIIGVESTANQTFNSSEQSLVKNYLDNGGMLFVSGAEIGWDLDNSGTSNEQDFYNNYLKVDYVDDAPNGQSGTHYSTEGITSSIFDGITSYQFDNGSNGTYDVNYPDVVIPFGGSSACLEFMGLTNEYAGVSFEGYFPNGNAIGKLVHLTVPFETFYPEANRNNLMEDVLDFFAQAPAPVPTPPSTPTNFCVLAESATSIRVITSVDTNNVGYNVYLSTDNTNFTLDANYTSSNFTIPGLTSNTAYYVKLEATNTVGTSGQSEVLGASTTINSDVLIVNAFDRVVTGNTKSFVFQHGTSIINNGRSFSSATNDAIISGLILLNNYPIVDYLLGEESTADETFSTVEQALVEAYLQQGGKLFVTGSEIGWDLDNLGSANDKSFYANYLKADYKNDAPNGQAATHYQVNEIAGDIFHGLGVINFDDGTNGTYDVNYPDQIDTINGSSRTMNYASATNAVAGIKYAGLFPGGSAQGKLVHLGVPFETFYPANSRDSIMLDVLNFFEDAPTVINNPTAVFSTSLSVACEQTDIQFSNASFGGSTPYSYNWNFDNGNASTQENPTHNYSTAGTYIVSLTVTDNNSNSHDTIMGVTITAPTPVSLTTPSLVCEDETPFSLTATPTGGSWNGNGITNSNGEFTPSSAALSSNSVYYTYNDGNCISQDSATIIVDSLPIITGAANQTIYEGDTATISIGGGIGYQWSTGQNTSSIDVTPTQNTTYIVTVTNSVCSSTESITITALPIPDTVNTQFTATTPVCLGDTTFTTNTTNGGETPYSYLWSFNGTNYNTEEPYHVFSSAGNHTINLTVTDNNGISSTETTTVSVTDYPNYSISNNTTITEGDTTQLSVSSGYSYDWNTGENTSVIEVSPDTSTRYFVTISNGICVANDSVFVSVTPTEYPDPLQVTVSHPSSLCLNEDSQFNSVVTGGLSPYQYNWNWSSDQSSSDSSPTIALTSSGTVFVNLTVTDANNNSTNYNGNVAVSDQFNAAIIPVSSSCENGPDFTLIGTPSGGIWSGEGIIDSLSGIYSPSTAGSGLHTILYQFDGSCGDTTTTLVIVDELPVFNEISGDSTLCNGQSTVLAAPSGYTYQWSTNQNSNAITVSPSSTQTYAITVYNQSCSITDDITIEVGDSSIANFGYTQNGCNLFFSDSSTNATTWSWDFGDGNTSNLSSPWNSYDTCISTIVCLTVSNNGFCESNYCDTITFEPNSILEITGDDITVYPTIADEYITIVSSNEEIEAVKIYSTQGQLVLIEQNNFISKKLNVSSISNGNYIIQLTTQKRNISQPIIIAR